MTTSTNAPESAGGECGETWHEKLENNCSVEHTPAAPQPETKHEHGKWCEYDGNGKPWAGGSPYCSTPAAPQPETLCDRSDCDRPGFPQEAYCCVSCENGIGHDSGCPQPETEAMTEAERIEIANLTAEINLAIYNTIPNVTLAQVERVNVRAILTAAKGGR